MTKYVSEIFDANEWEEVPGFEFKDITYHKHNLYISAYLLSENDLFRDKWVFKLVRLLKF